MLARRFAVAALAVAAACFALPAAAGAQETETRDYLPEGGAEYYCRLSSGLTGVIPVSLIVRKWDSTYTLIPFSGAAGDSVLFPRCASRLNSFLGGAAVKVSAAEYRVLTNEADAVMEGGGLTRSQANRVVADKRSVRRIGDQIDRLNEQVEALQLEAGVDGDGGTDTVILRAPGSDAYNWSPGRLDAHQRRIDSLNAQIIRLHESADRQRDNAERQLCLADPRSDPATC